MIKNNKIDLIPTNREFEPNFKAPLQVLDKRSGLLKDKKTYQQNLVTAGSRRNKVVWYHRQDTEDERKVDAL